MSVVKKRIEAFGGWRAETLLMLRELILKAEPEMEEACKWAKASNPQGVAVWSRASIVCTGEAYKTAVKLTFPHGAALPDPNGLFNASLTGNARRAIDVKEGESLPAAAFQTLIRAAVTENLRRSAAKPATRRKT